jgi:hypothetical protein
MAVGWIRRRPEKAVRTLNIKTLSDRLVAATAGANRRTPCIPIPSNQLSGPAPLFNLLITDHVVPGVPGVPGASTGLESAEK